MIESNTTKALLLATITATGLTSDYGHVVDRTFNYQTPDYSNYSKSSLMSNSFHETDETTVLFWEKNRELLSSIKNRENFVIDSKNANMIQIAESFFEGSIYLEEKMELALSKTIAKVGKTSTKRNDRF